MVSTLFCFSLVVSLFLAHGIPVKRTDDAGTLEPIIQQLTDDVTSLQAKLAAMETSMQEKITSLETEVQTLKAKETHHVAFAATIGASSVPASAQDVIIPFTHVVTNVGGAYDPHTSVFRAPYDGEYMFLVSVDVSTNYMRLFLERSGHAVIHGHNDINTGHHITTGGALTLKAGDTVTVNHGNDVVGSIDGGPESVFTGFLIR